MKYEDAVEEVFAKCRERFKAGEAEYGRMTFLDASLAKEAEEELLDFINYATMLLLKLNVLAKKYSLE